MYNFQYCLYLFIFEFEGFFSFFINSFDLVIEDCKSPFVIHADRFKYLLSILFCFNGNAISCVSVNIFMNLSYAWSGHVM